MLVITGSLDSNFKLPKENSHVFPIVTGKEAPLCCLQAIYRGGALTGTTLWFSVLCLAVVASVIYPGLHCRLLYICFLRLSLHLLRLGSIPLSVSALL